MTDSTQPQLTTFLDQAEFARSLAGRWTADGHQAEDLVQDALIIALDLGEPGDRQSRGWWGKLVKNLGMTRRRGDARRIHRERSYAQRASGRGAPDHKEAAADRHRLLAAVEQLPTRYRVAIQLRYLEGHTARAAAQLAGCPESTMATRTAEALRRLRVVLGQERETGRNPWLAALCIPIRTWREASGPLSPTNSFLMGNTLKLAATVGLVACLFYAVNKSLGADTPSLVRSEPPSTELPPGELSPAEAFVASRTGERVAEPGGAPAETKKLYHEPGFHHPPYANLSRTPLTIEGRVVDLTGQIVAGIQVVASDYAPRPGRAPKTKADQPVATTDSRGEFQLEVLAGSVLKVDDARYATVYGVNVFTREEESPGVIVVAPRVQLAGTVVTEFGEPLPNAALTHLVPRRVYDVPGDDLARSTLIPRSATTDEFGRFQFAEMPDLRTSEFVIQAQGYEDGQLAFPPGGDANVRIVLGRASAGPEMITGIVRHLNGDPAPSAWVSAGILSVLTDTEGHFALDLTPGGHQHQEKTAEVLHVKAVLAGFLPAKVTAPSVQVTLEAGERKPIELVLGGPCLSIEGRVVDAAGNPLAGLAVRVTEAEAFGLTQEGQFGWGMFRTLEDMMGGGDTTTNGSGRFRLSGLLDRDYTIEVLQRPSLLCTTSDPIAAGAQDVELVLDIAKLRTAAGTIVDRHGSPIEGVTISVSRKWPGSLEIGVRAVTGSDGTFRLEQVTPDPVYLRLEGAPVVTDLFYELPEGADLESLEVLAARRCEIQFEFGDWGARADTVMAVDAFGEQVGMMYEQGNTIGVRPTVQIGSGYSDVFLLGDIATHIVLLSGEEEVERYPIVLTPGEILVLRL